jgi:hypothetical protein
MSILEVSFGKVQAGTNHQAGRIMTLESKMRSLLAISLIASTLTLCAADNPQPPPEQKADPTKPKPEFPPHTEVLKDYQEVISSLDKTNSLFSIWVRRKDDKVLARLFGVGPRLSALEKMVNPSSKIAGSE